MFYLTDNTNNVPFYVRIENLKNLELIRYASIPRVIARIIKQISGQSSSNFSWQFKVIIIIFNKYVLILKGP